MNEWGPRSQGVLDLSATNVIMQGDHAFRPPTTMNPVFSLPLPPTTMPRIPHLHAKVFRRIRWWSIAGCFGGLGWSSDWPGLVRLRLWFVCHCRGLVHVPSFMSGFIMYCHWKVEDILGFLRGGRRVPGDSVIWKFLAFARTRLAVCVAMCELLDQIWSSPCAGLIRGDQLAVPRMRTLQTHLRVDAIHAFQMRVSMDLRSYERKATIDLLLALCER